MAMAAGRCDLYSLLLVTLFWTVPNRSEGEGSLLQQTADKLMPQSWATVKTDITTENVLSLGRWKKILPNNTFKVPGLQINFIIFNNIMCTYS